MPNPYTVTLVPLGLHPVNVKTEAWRVYAVCVPELGTAETAQLDTAAIVGQHPLIGRQHIAMTFTSDAGAAALSAKIVEPGDLALLRSILSAAETDTNLRNLQERKPVVTEARPTNSEHFVDVTEIYAKQCREYMQGLIATVSGGEGARALDVSEFASWDSYRARLAAIDEEEWAAKLKQLKPEQSGAISQYRDALQHNRKCPSLVEPPFSVSQRELVFSILQYPELALRTGLIVELSVELPYPLEMKSVDGQLTLHYYLTNPATTTTHTRRRPLSSEWFVVEPASRFEYLDATTLLARVDGRPDADRRPTSTPYEMRSFSTDHSVVRGVLAPNFGTSDKVPTSRYPNRFASKGMQPFVGGSMTLDGPVDDLVSQSRRTLFEDCDAKNNIHCLETLWDGYRLDVASDRAVGQPRYLSIHHQCRSFAFGLSKPLVFNDAEDCIYRLQRVQNARQDKDNPSRILPPAVHPALYSWDGTATFESLPWANGGNFRADGVWVVDYSRDTDGRARKVLPRLEYGTHYEFRLRKVFQGGLSLSLAEADRLMHSMKAEIASQYVISQQHTRSRPFSPGVLYFPGTPESKSPMEGKDCVLRVGKRRESIEFWIYPHPLDREEARFHGLLRKSWEERRIDLLCVEGNLSKYLSSGKHDPAHPVYYYADPDVTQVRLRAWTLGNQWLSTDINPIVDRKLSANKAAIRSTDVEPVSIGEPAVLRFGTAPFDLRPIRVRICATNSNHAKLSSSAGKGKFDWVEIHVPCGDRIKVELLPDFTDDAHKRHTAWKELIAGTPHAVVKRQEKDLRYLLPTLTVPLTFEAIHTIALPLKPPAFERLLLQDGDDPAAELIQVSRKDKESAMSLTAAVQVDPRTTGSVMLEARWRTYVDDIAFPGPLVTGQRSMRTGERSVYFGPALGLDEEAPATPMSSAALRVRALSSAELYSTERTVLFGVSVDSISARSAGVRVPKEAENRDATMEIGDLRHYRITVSALSRGRYAADYPGEAATLTSSPQTVDLHSGMVLPAPAVSHVIAMSSPPAFQELDSHWVSHRRQLMRIYLHRPWCISGEGELLAVVFDRDWRAQNHRDALEIPSPATAWGEDPLYRTFEKQTVDNISPQHVQDMFSAYVERAKFEDDYPVMVQGELSGDIFNLVSGLDPAGEKGPQDYRNAHLIGVRPSYDKQQKLWYVDVDPGDRNRWIRFKLARFQPIAKPGYHVSCDAAFINFLCTRDITVTVVRHIDVVEIMLDTIPYSGRQLDQDSLSPEGRFNLLFTDQISEGVYRDKMGSGKADSYAAPPLVSIQPDVGNVRYVWKLAAAGWDVAIIRDAFRQSIVANIVRNELP